MENKQHIPWSGLALGVGLVALLLWPKESKGENETVTNNETSSSGSSSTPTSDDNSLPYISTNDFWSITNNNLPRGCDPQGCGHYHASRGSRLHNGIDLAAQVGESVFAGIYGKITRHLRVYSNDPRYIGLEIQGTGIHSSYKMKLFYVDQMLPAGTVVSPSSIVGKAQNIAAKYSGITNHVHIELYQNGQRINPSSFIK